ncbi:unnamed protein product [Miscanthus lutarioriparius]|uniref:Protein kinase domain-containing protein n=1 Tax=Miscanthus lutarioriparius TaxID=422564 RepID=A0A811Q1A0_9POAL|nr:unnamed protein product [Miscanthus lutarioriparius]
MQHQNIVRLLGYCHEPQKKVIEHSGRYIIVDVVESMLYYEYVPNGNLDSIFSVRETWTDEHIASKHSALLDAGSLQEVRTCIEIGLKCVDVDQNKRPSIVEIVDKLNGRHAP